MTTTKNDEPRIWLVLGDKLGDNAQVEALARAVSLPYELRQVFPKPEWVLGKPPFEVSLAHLDPQRSAPLEPPWPDLVMTVGRRPSMAALWVRERSGGRTKIVLVGRPKKWIERFELVVAPGQFKIPARANVVKLDLPLMRADPARVAAEAERWRDRLAGLPRPLTAVLVGGVTNPYRFDAAVARSMLGKLEGIVARDGGTLYISTSRRTRADVVEALGAGLPGGAALYRWQAEAADENPYLALLGLADRFVVTGDSISMLVEVASLGKPLAIAELPVGFDRRDRLRRDIARFAQRSLGRLVQSLQTIGAAGYERDLGMVHRHLYRRGLAVPLGQPFPAGGGDLADELAPVAARVRAMVGR